MDTNDHNLAWAGTARTLILSALVAVSAGCDPEDPRSQPLPAGSAQVEDTEAELREIPASPATAVTSGVASWRVYDGEEVRVVGVDADGLTIAEFHFRVDAGEDGAMNGVVVDSVLPERGTVAFDAEGHMVGKTLTATSTALLRAVSADIQAAGSDEVTPRSAWGCAKATFDLVAACGYVGATCFETFGFTCVLGGAACVAAALDWQCECRGIAC